MPQGKAETSTYDYPKLGREVLEISRNGGICKLPAGLYLVATPIGHMGDITLRALTTLSDVDRIACEDTRTSGILLQAFGIKTQTTAYHDHNANQKRPEILSWIAAGQAVALISDAGLPAIADPGFKLVRDCREAGYSVTVIPGACAAVTAMASSGLPTDRFTFAGFLPPKSVARQKMLHAYKRADETVIFYEAPQRLTETLNDMAQIMGSGRSAVVARELTKFFEDVRFDTLADLSSHYKAHPPKGEIVILVAKGDEETSFDLDGLLSERLKSLSVRDAVAEVADMTGLPKKEVYARALVLAPSEKS